VFHIGSTGKVYCTDAKTGQPLWESSLGERNEWMEDIKRYMVATGNPFSSRSDFVSNPAVAEGVLVACDHLRAKVDYRYERNNGLIGLDARTGKRLWHVPQCSSNGPVLWRHAGRTYVLGFARKGGATCIDPRTGKVLWREPGARRGHTNVAISGDVLVCDSLPEQSDQRRPWAPIRAYRLSPRGAELVWELPKPIGNSTGGPTIYDGKAYIHAKQPESTMLCVDLATGKILAKTGRPYGDNGEHDNAFFVSVDGRLMGSMDRGSYAWGPTDPKQFGQDKPWHAPTAVGYVSTIMPAVADGRVFFRASNRLICWDIRERFAVESRPDRPTPKPRKTDDDSEGTKDDPKRPPSGKDGKGGKSDKPGKPSGPDLEGMLEDDDLPDPLDSLD
jgi:outer membrane protein assembly factor BamB